MSQSTTASSKRTLDTTLSRETTDESATSSIASKKAKLSVVITPHSPTCENTDFKVKDWYDIEHILGKGAFGQVYQAKHKKRGNLAVALKALRRTCTTPDAFTREVTALQALAPHKHIITCYDWHQDEQYYYLALELVPGGELFEYLAKHNGPFSEAQAARYMRQLAEALCSVHKAGWVHGDLKPENLCLSADYQTLKVIDWGCATTIADNKKNVSTTGGTTAYMPPERFGSNGAATPPGDMWAVGVILFILLTGYHPLDPKSDDEMVVYLQRVHDSKTPRILLESHVFDQRTAHLTPSVLKLLHQLLEADPSRRMTAESFLGNSWVQGLTASWTTLAESDAKLEAFWHRAFRKEIIKRFLSSTRKTNSQKPVTLSDENLLQIFTALDLNGDGVLQLSELQSILQDMGASDVSQIFAFMDLENSGFVRWEEFCAIMRRKFHQGPGVRVRYRQERFQKNILQHFGVNSQVAQSKLREIFDALDLDGNGVLDAHEIRVVLRSLGEDDESISKIVAAIDSNHDGKVDWNEFRTAMLKKYR